MIAQTRRSVPLYIHCLSLSLLA